MSTIDWVRESEYLRGLLSQEKKKNAILENDIKILKELWFKHLNEEKAKEFRSEGYEPCPDSCTVGGI